MPIVHKPTNSTRINLVRLIKLTGFSFMTSEVIIGTSGKNPCTKTLDSRTVRSNLL